MTDIEYDILDELYFVTSYKELKEQTGFGDDELQSNLSCLIDAELVKVYLAVDEELQMENLDLAKNYRSYYYLATKKGLFEHNQR